MKNKIYWAYLIPALLIFFFSFTKSYSQIEEDTSSMGPPNQTPTLEDFKDSLSSKGEWVKVNKDQIDPENNDQVDTEYVDEDICTDYVWVPNPVFIWAGWSPYCYGHWVWTIWGWEWFPDYDWGWCTYHYGRWWYSNYYGWCWSPGWRWRSHWVTWCRSGGYWGWHPVPPRTRIRDGVAVLPVNHNTKNGGWVFVDKKNFTKPVNNTTRVDPKYNTDILRGSKQYVTKDANNKYSVPNTKTQNSGVGRKSNKENYNNNNTWKKQVSVDNKSGNNSRKVVVVRRGNQNEKSSGNYRNSTRSSNNGSRSYNSGRSSSNGRSNSGSHSNGSRSSSHSSNSSHGNRK